MGFGYERIVKDYTGMENDQSFTPGIETELFYNESEEVLDYSAWDESDEFPAVWGNQIPEVNTKHIRTCSPHVYAKVMTDNEFLVEQHETIFLPRSDQGWVDMNVIEHEEFYEKIWDFYDEKSVLVSWPREMRFWREMFPSEQIKAVGSHRNRDMEWCYNLIYLIKRSSKLYFCLFGTASVLAAMYNKDIEFYDPGDVYIPLDGPQYSPKHQSERWNYTVDHFKAVLSDKAMTDDKKYLIYNFFSLDKFQSPEQLKNSLVNCVSGPYTEYNEYLPISPTKETVELYESLRIFQDQKCRS